MLNPQLILFDQLIKKQQLKNTPSRKQVFETLLWAGRPLSPQQIVQTLPQVNPSTIYRSLETLTQAQVTKPVFHGFKTLYELSEYFLDHHHHVVCEQCGRMVEVENDKIEILIEQITRQAGMKPTLHRLELYGLCESCQSSRAESTTALMEAS